MARPAHLCLLVPFLILANCTPAPSPAVSGEAQQGAFTFTYAMDLGRDCFMMGDCGYRIVLSLDGMLRRFDDRNRETASASLSSEEQAVLLEQLEAGGFFELPMRLPDVPEEEMPRGGRVVTMAYENADGSRSHQVEAHTDAGVIPLPEQFYALDEGVRTYLLSRLGEG